MSNTINDIKNDLRRGNTPILYQRFSHEELEGWDENQRRMEEELSIVSGRSLRAGSQVEYERIQQKINSQDEEVVRNARILRDELNEQMEEDVESYARVAGIWAEDTSKTLRERHRDRIASGGEEQITIRTATKGR